MSAPPCPVCRSTESHAYRTPDPTPVRRCHACGARWVWPIPAAAQLRERYRDEHERGEWSRRFENTPREEWERRAAIVAGLAPQVLPRIVLDVGCGDGRFLDAMARREWRTFGSEIALPGARLASTRHRTLVGELASLARVPLFQAITYWDVLEHLPDPASHVDEAASRLADGGVLAISMPNVQGSSSAALRRRWPYYDFKSYGHLHHLSPQHLERLLADAGMAPIYRETRGSVDLRFVPEYYGLAPPTRAVAWGLDRLSGAVARIAQPLGFGNTTVVVGRKRGNAERSA